MARTLGRKKDQREALIRNLGRSLVLHEAITTTEPKAKEVVRTLDRWMTIAKRAATAPANSKLSVYRELLTRVRDASATQKLVSDLAVRSKDRSSGFTRRAKVSARVGDASPRMKLWLTDQPAPVQAAPKEAKQATDKTAKTTVKTTVKK